MTESGSPANLKSVTARIGDAVIEFLDRRQGQNFTDQDLVLHVTNAVGWVAPSSPGRVMRSLRAQGIVNYQLLSRSKSLYRSVPNDIPAPYLIPDKLSAEGQTQ